MKRKKSNKIKKIVIKIGTGVLTSNKNVFDKQRIKGLVAQVCSLLNQNIQVVIVSSGAIGAGMGALKLKTRPKALPKLQAAAAVGQSQLMKIYDDLFKKRSRHAAQLLLTREDFVNRRRYVNAKNTLSTLLRYKTVPVINENDTVSVDEIKFGDNDRLSALVARMIGADLLIILSDVDGLYKGKEVVSLVERITPGIKRIARGTTKESAMGGMITKVEAAKIATRSGIRCIVANGFTKNILTRLIKGENLGTLFK